MYCKTKLVFVTIIKVYMILIFLYSEQKQRVKRKREREREREPFTNNYVDFSAVKCKQKYPEILSDLKKNTKFTII